MTLADSHCRLADDLLRQGHYAQALAGYRDAIRADPAHAAAWLNAGVMHAQLGQAAEAEHAYLTVLSLRPDDAGAHTNLGLVLEARRRYDEAEHHQRHALAQAPSSPQVRCHLADLLSRTGREAEAELHYREALRLDPASSIALSNLGVLFFDMGRDEEAERAFRAALAVHPLSVSARLNLGQLLLRKGRFAAGWTMCDVRYQARLPGALPAFPMETGLARRWTGGSLAGQRLLVWPEQGYGDQIQFCRYLCRVRALRPKRLTLVCSAPLLGLMQGLHGPDELLTLDQGAEALSRHDFWAPLLGLPLLLADHPHHGLSRVTPYLSAESQRVAQWAHRMPDARSGMRVGLVWRGHAAHDNDADRSLPGLSTLAPLWAVPGVQFISLQKLAGEDEAKAPALNQPLVHLGSDIQDFSDTAAILAQLDLLITVDTAVAHVAGALNMPCWVMLPARRCDWRWMQHRTDSPWYPSMRLFRQPARGDWQTPVEAVRQALSRRVRDNG